jgi:hypothetical protein
MTSAKASGAPSASLKYGFIHAPLASRQRMRGGHGNVMLAAERGAQRRRTGWVMISFIMAGLVPAIPLR